MLTNVNEPTRIRLPDGRTAVVTVTLDGARDALPGSTLALPVLPPPPPTAPPPPPSPPPSPPPPPAKPLAAGVKSPTGPASPLDHPAIGGRVTVFVLCYGDFADLHQRCLGAIVATTPAARVDLRVIGNVVCPATREYVRRLVADGRVSVFYDHATNRKKYPAMRDAFRDPDRPITTPWLVWFDDDTICAKNPKWLDLLAAEIVGSPDPRLGMVGSRFFYTITPAQAAWLSAAGWFRGRPFRDKTGNPAPNGTRVHFGVGAFWAMRTACVTECDIPDARLGHNGGDWTIGEQLYQNNWNLKNWNANKAIVQWSSVPRRGLNEKHPAA